MKTIPIAISILFVFISNGCTSHDSSQVQDNGKWVSIYDAPITCGYILHDNKIYGLIIDMEENYDENMFENEYIDDALLIEDADIPTFEVNLISDYYQTSYAKDKKHVYCPVEMEFIEWDVGVKMPYSTILTGDIILPGADPKTFKYLGGGYAFDKKHMYWIDKIISGADPTSFKYLGKCYAIDKDHMYLYGSQIEWNDYIITALQQPDCPKFLPKYYGMPNGK